MNELPSYYLLLTTSLLRCSTDTSTVVPCVVSSLLAARVAACLEGDARRALRRNKTTRIEYDAKVVLFLRAAPSDRAPTVSAIGSGTAMR